MEMNKESFRPPVPDASKVRILKPEQQKKMADEAAAKLAAAEKKPDAGKSLLAEFAAGKKSKNDVYKDLATKLKEGKPILDKEGKEIIH